jgi:hypothetical protein
MRTRFEAEKRSNLMAKQYPMKINLDSDTYVAELSATGQLSLTNDHVKEELDLSSRATYDLLIFLHEHAAQIYQAVRQPKEAYPEEEHTLTILQPTGNEGETTKPKEQDRILYGDETDPLLLSVYDLVGAWAESAYNGPAIVTRIDSVPFDSKQCEPEEPEVLRGLLNWDTPRGEVPTQAWRVTLWPQWGYKNFMANHVYVHRYGDQLSTGTSEWQSGTPHFLWLPETDEEEDHA